MALLSGCRPAPPTVDAIVWGRKGLDDGRFMKPRAIAIDDADQMYIVDMTSRIQVFDSEGQFKRAWKTPECTVGKPCGLSFSNDGQLMVADTHYFRVLFYSPDGVLDESRTIGGVNGRGEGEFGFVTDVVQDESGNFYVSEYGDFDRIQQFDSDGNFLSQWGGHGDGEGEFLRPQGMAIDSQNRLWVADACNHRIQVFDLTKSPPTFLFAFGSHGSSVGKLSYPYSLFHGDDGFVYVCEYGNHRIQKFSTDGRSMGVWGGPGRQPGQMHQPWAAAVDSQNWIHVLDSYNHRVQRFAGVGDEHGDVWNLSELETDRNHEAGFIDEPPDQ